MDFIEGMIDAYVKILKELVELEKKATDKHERDAYAYLIETSIPDEIRHWKEQDNKERNKKTV